MIVPTLKEFEQVLSDISEEANAAIEQIYMDAVSQGLVYESGHMKDISAVGTSVMYLDGRSALYKFFKSIPNDPEKSYSINVYSGSVRISFRNVFYGQSFKLRTAAYDVLIEKLRAHYNWDIYNDVRVD